MKSKSCENIDTSCKIQEWIAKGHEILEKEYWKEWDSCVPVRLDDVYQGKELKNCLDIVKVLNDGCSISEAKEILKSQNLSGASYHLVRLMVKTFCKRGNEFAESLMFS